MPKTQARTTREAQIDKKLAPATQDELKAQVEAYMSGRLDSVVRAKVNPLTGWIKLQANGEDILSTSDLNVSSGYFCHLWAGSSGNGDGYVPDLSGALAHAQFAAGLTKAIAWANAGFATSGTAANNQGFVLPVLGFDYAAGESLILVWKGRGTPPASTKVFVGDSPSSGTAGFAVRVDATGKIQSFLSDGAGTFTDVSTNVLVEAGITHTYALAIDGVARKYEQHEDGVVVRSLIALGAVGSINCKTARAVTLGSGEQPTMFAANEVAVQTQSLVILRGRAGLGLPTNYRALMQRIAASPDRLVSQSDW